MPKIFTLFSVAALLIVFSSCHKHNDSAPTTPKGPLDGTWNLGSYGANAIINTSTVAHDSVVIVSDFVSIDNKGAITFAGDSMAASGIGYVIDDSASATLYYYGILAGTTPLPIKDTVSPVSYTFNYQLVGTDSIYFPLGGFVANVGLETGETIVISGAHFTISGNVLTLTSTTVQADTINEAGHSFPAVTQIKSTIVLNKQ